MNTVDFVAKNIVRLCVPIPFPLRTVNMYALIGEGGWTLIDAGIGTPDTRTAFAEGLKEAGLRIEQLQSIVLTHHHPDHVGLSGELQEQSGAKIYMHRLEEQQLQALWSGSYTKRFAETSQFFAQHGLVAKPHWLTNVAPETLQSIIRIPAHETFTLIEDGADIELANGRYRVIWTPGHADGQICLWHEEGRMLLSADHVLPRITPNIGLYAEKNREDPLQDYLNALTKVGNVPARITLPGHGVPFETLQERVVEIRLHHEQRLEQIMMYLREQPQNAYQLTQQFFGERLKDHEAWRMALAEILAHLEYLRFKDQVERQMAADGVFHYEIK